MVIEKKAGDYLPHELAPVSLKEEVMCSNGCLHAWYSTANLENEQ